jgi:hypothetical protein
MCALVSSLASQSTDHLSKHGKVSHGRDIDKQKQRDVSLCTQYTLTFAKIQGTTNSYGQDPGVMRTATLPVIFCGIHNPEREHSFYGLYPGGKYLGSPNILRIPKCKEGEDEGE